MSELKTPGVYVNEVSTLPPSVAQVETAIPVFIGYTQGGPQELTKVQSLLEYENIFGGAYQESIELQDTEDGSLILAQPTVKFLMYYSIQMFFANGGGQCYIISVGNYKTGNVLNEVELGTTDEGLLKGLEDLHKDDAPTMIVFPDATALTDQEQFYALYNTALLKAGEQNRFVIIDTYRGNTTEKDDNLDTIENFRDKINSSNHGAAYFPHLKTILNYTFDEEVTKIKHTGLQVTGSPSPFFAAEKAALVQLQSEASGILDTAEPDADALGELLSQAIAIVTEVNETADLQIDLSDAYEVLEAINDGIINDFDAPVDADTPSFTDEFVTLITALQNAEDKKGAGDNKTLKDLKTFNPGLYYRIKKEMAAMHIVLPPSSAISGVYAKTDSTFGVWKAPANTGLNYVMSTTQKISNEEQESLNVDADGGKSINAIRNFTGKGILVWGARTLDSNSSEWKYIPVRRLFTMVERSLEKATTKFLFEPNDTNTWLRTKAMCENYLYQLWRDGALAGSTPEEAYYVAVGGETMNSTDIYEGRMNIEIGLAAVRPAEFIVLNFSHKLQEA